MTFEARTIRPGDAEFPASLAHISRSPGQLRIRGSLGQPAARVAIVGSRRPDASGERFAKQLARDLVRAGVSVVSGGALGIDAAAHAGAMDAGGHTVAVFGTGLDVFFPSEHRGLFRRILESGGALISEFEDDQPGARWTFPERNRIVSGMSDAVVVVQAGERSGALLTAQHAVLQRVPVFAVPGDPANRMSAGPNALLRQGARPAESAGDVLRLLGLEGQLRLEVEETPALDGPEAALWAALGVRPQHAAELARAAGLPMGPALAGLLGLEMRGLCEQRPGHYFSRRI